MLGNNKVIDSFFYQKTFFNQYVDQVLYEVKVYNIHCLFSITLRVTNVMDLTVSIMHAAF